MIDFLNVVRFCFPFVALFLFFVFYGKKSKRMCRFYSLMVMTKNGTRFYALIVYTALLFFSWCSHVCDPGLASLLSGAFVFPLVFYKWTNTILTVLREYKSAFYISLVFSTLLYTVPQMHSFSVIVFVLALSAAFYPSRKMLSLLANMDRYVDEKDEDFNQRVKSIVIEEYY